MPPGDERGMRLSVIIPTLNEEAMIAGTLESVRSQRPHEIIVVDGDSADGTVRLAEPLADRLLLSVRGRAAQMNLGAAQASGDILLFLHADCTLEAGALGDAERLLQRLSISAGCFTMRVPLRSLLFRSIEFCATARVRLFGIPYGDQGLFLRRESWERAGGFPDLHLMEDVFLGLQLRKMGRIVVSRRHVFPSPRRWQKSGIIRQTLRNWALTAAAAAGVHPDWLARYYPAVR
jgi:rSAM/selenodomain-associated transferase 2